MRDLDFRTVIDVGANGDRFSWLLGGATSQLLLWPRAKFFCVEPNPRAAEALLRAIPPEHKERVHLWTCALGSGHADPTTLHAPLGMSEMGSLLRPTDWLLDVHGIKREDVKAVDVVVATLDSLMCPLGAWTPIRLKLDVQGYELEVLRGAELTLGRVDEILCEVTLSPCYEGQATMGGICTFLEERGFVYMGNSHQQTESRVKYVDAWFRKRGLE